MKKTATLFLSLFVAGSSIFAQGNKNDKNSGVITCTDFHITRPLSEIFAENPVDDNNKVYKNTESEDRDHNKPQKFPAAKKDPANHGNDPASMQTTMGTIPGKSPITNWAGQTASGFYPMDPVGAAGPNHYVQMINATTFKVYNKTTGAVMLTGILGNLWSPALTYNDGDPIVLYDKAADRWLLAQFGDNDGAAGNKIHIAISTTANPTGSYYTYTFTSPQFPDYLKFSVWQDGYYMTSNQNQKVFAFERTQMLAGSATARAVYQSFSPPNAGYFFVPLPGDAGDGVLPPAGTPCPIFSYSDNGWGTTYTDAINIYKVAVNWVPTTPTETITSAGSVPTAAFDATYDPSWNDCPQPGTTQKLDGIGGVCMFRAQWKTWSGYNTVVLNWGVKISATQRSIKWCELRQNQTTGVWSMYQEGIYTPDAATRWMGSIAMDNNGSIALCYVKSDATSIYPGLYYTGRRSCDPLGTLPITETLAKAGTGSQTGGINRDGDYAETWLDPDGITFWHTGLYMGGSTGTSAARTQIYSFQIAPCTAVTPVANFSATPTAACVGQNVSFTDLSTNFPTSWSWTFTGGTPSSSTVQNPVVVYNTPGTYSVTLTATNTAGSSTPVTMTGYITVNPVPAAPTAGNNGPLCSGATLNLTSSTVTGATYTWTGPASYTSSTQNPSRPSTTTAMAGTYSLTATVGGCSSVIATTVVVINATPTATTPANLSVCKGATVSPSAFVSSPTGATFTWTNSNTSIGLGASGSGNIPSFTATNTGTTPISGTITFTPTSAASCVGAPHTFTITVNPIPATPTITQSGLLLTSSSATGNQWYLNGTLIPGATSQTYTATANGTYTVVVTTSGCSSASSSSVVISNVGIQEETNPYMFSIYPNPNDGNFNISFNALEKSTYTLQLFNALGQIIYKDELTNYSGAYTKKLSVTEYGKGVYTITLTNSKNETVKKIIVY